MEDSPEPKVPHCLRVSNARVYLHNTASNVYHTAQIIDIIFTHILVQS